MKLLPVPGPNIMAVVPALGGKKMLPLTRQLELKLYTVSEVFSSWSSRSQVLLATMLPLPMSLRRIVPAEDHKLSEIWTQGATLVPEGRFDWIVSAIKLLRVISTVPEQEINTAVTPLSNEQASI